MANEIYFLTNPLNVITTPCFQEALNTGSVYYITTGIIDVGANDFIVVQFTNPTTALFVYFLLLTGGSDNRNFVELISNGTFIDGNVITPINANTGYTNSSFVAVKYINSPSDPVIGGQLMGSYVQANGIRSADSYGLLKLSPGHSICIRVKNAKNSVNSLSINAIFRQAAQ